MSAKEKRIQRMRENATNWQMADVIWLLEKQAGCVARQRGTSHRIFTHPSKAAPSFPDGVNVPSNRPIKARYIAQALDYYDELMNEED